MLLSDMIAGMIEELLEEQGGTLELQRNDMATRVGCAPSQINYVIASRFTPRHGYLVESHRGGGGYIRIVKKELHRDAYLMHFLASIGDSITETEGAAMLRNLFACRVFSPDVTAMLTAAVANTTYTAIPDKTQRNKVRADVLRHLLLTQLNRS